MWADWDTYQFMLKHILSNAIKHSRKVSKIGLNFRVVTIDDNWTVKLITEVEDLCNKIDF